MVKGVTDAFVVIFYASSVIWSCLDHEHSLIWKRQWENYVHGVFPWDLTKAKETKIIIQWKILLTNNTRISCCPQSCALWKEFQKQILFHMTMVEKEAVNLFMALGFSNIDLFLINAF